MVKYRSGRINEEMRKEISDIIHNEIRDPRLTAMVSVTKVDVTKDLRYAKVFVSIYGNEEERKNSLSALKSSTSFIRREVGYRVNLRYTPEITIELDTTIEHGMHINSLIEKLKENTRHET